MIVPVILAGGSGTRLWPLSRELYPKQFMRLTDDRTLLQHTWLRLQGLPDLARPILLCNEAHRFIVAEQLRQIDCEPAAIVLEPVGRNTAPALAVAALMAERQSDAAILLALPADHYIRNPSGLIETATRGADLAREGFLVTFGIEPRSPETGYGYIQKGERLEAAGDRSSEKREAWRIAKFVEKPDRATAQAYLDSGRYYWNSGMFMFSAGVLLSEMERNAPRIVGSCREAVSGGCSDLDFLRLDRPAFEKCPSDSIDYAVMEKTRSGVVVALASEWNDLGSWEALWQAGDKDGDQNVVHGDVCLQGVRHSFVHATSRLVTAVGLDHHVVVETADAVFVAPRDQVQQVKALVNGLKSRHRIETLNHKKVYRPWGFYEDMDVAERFLIKRITVKPQAKLSLQKHIHRAEHWVVVKGTALVTKGSDQFLLQEDQSTYIPLGTIHRLENPGKIPLELVEVQTGSYIGEDDVRRLDDVYGRHNDSQAEQHPREQRE